MSGVAAPFNGHVDEFRISHVQRSDGWIETTWNNISDPGAFAVAAAEEQAGNEPHGQRTGHAIIAVGDVLLVAADPIERLRRDDVEALGLRVREERLDARPQQAGPGDGLVGIALDQLPALALRVLSAQPELILDRGLALVVRGVAGVDGDLGHGVNPHVLSAASASLRLRSITSRAVSRASRGRGRIGCRGARG